MKNRKVLISLIAIVFILTGCPKKPPKVVTPPPEKPEELPPPVEITEPDIRGEEFVSLPELNTVYFEYDKASLTDEAKKILEQNAKFLLDNPQYEVLIEGHCCECGSNEYNLGLGQRRSTTIREYYILLGIPGDKIATISYGEEKPVYKNVGPPDSPECKWNRRGETKVRVKK